MVVRSYVIRYRGLKEGYEILKSEEEFDWKNHFPNITEAKKEVVRRSNRDIADIRSALKTTQRIRKEYLYWDDVHNLYEAIQNQTDN